MKKYKIKSEIRGYIEGFIIANSFEEAEENFDINEVDLNDLEDLEIIDQYIEEDSDLYEEYCDQKCQEDMDERLIQSQLNQL